jgi:hypothetical protein
MAAFAMVINPKSRRLIFKLTHYPSPLQTGSPDASADGRIGDTFTSDRLPARGALGGRSVWHVRTRHAPQTLAGLAAGGVLMVQC